MTQWKGVGTANGARIIKVGALARDSLDIDFDNGSILILSVDLILGLPELAALAEDDRIYYPKTDGSSVYWKDGARALSVAEILELAGRAGNTANS